MIFKPHHTTRPPYPSRTRYLGLARMNNFGFDIPDWVFFFFSFFSFSCSIGFLHFFAFSTNSVFQRKVVYAWIICSTVTSQTHSPEPGNCLTRYWQREIRLERKHVLHSVLHGHVALFRVRTAIDGLGSGCDAADAMRYDAMRIWSSPDIPTLGHESQVFQIPFNSLVADWDDLRLTPRNLICTDRHRHR